VVCIEETFVSEEAVFTKPKMPIELSPDTFTYQEVSEIWQDCTTGASSQKTPAHKQFEDYSCYSDHFDTTLGTQGERYQEDRRKQLEAFCAQLLVKVKDPVSHMRLLNDALSEIFVYRFSREELEHEVVTRTCQMLSRLPAVVPDISARGHVPDWIMGFSCSSAYLVAESRTTKGLEGTSELPALPWKEFRVVRKLPAIVIRQALQISIRNRKRLIPGMMQRFVDLLAELLDTVDQNVSRLPDSELFDNFILKAFLWTAWQRSMMLLFYYVLERQLEDYSSQMNQLLAIRGTRLLSKNTLASQWDYDVGRPVDVSKYMCSWAFELLRMHRAAVGLDFRTFHIRYAAAHPDCAARCIWGRSLPCAGDNARNCQRFVDPDGEKPMVAAEQSVHDIGCAGQCPRLMWNEKSYDSTFGAKGVSFDARVPCIEYCTASARTLAISHVWSHGQGGRPSTGINSCLHLRYAEIARRHNCDSYWIDTVCIPEDHIRRRQAIKEINGIFGTSKVTLVCDRDLMKIDVADLTIQIAESLLVTLLVCDWNVRAWTLLEAIRGNQGLHLLCSRNQTISLKETLSLVCREGSIDLAILLLTTEHLLPCVPQPKSLEVAGNLLSHRYATRPGDDIVIWSLLSGTTIFESAEALWRSRIPGRGSPIKTGYLISSAPRLQDVEYFGWAPSTPVVHSRVNTHDRAYSSFDGERSEEGQVTPEGLLARWLAHDVSLRDTEAYKGIPWTAKLQWDEECALWVPQPLPEKPCNSCLHAAKELHRHYPWVRYLQPLTYLDLKYYAGAGERGEFHGPVFAICASKDRKSWEWKGVFEWHVSYSLPVFHEAFVILI